MIGGSSKLLGGVGDSAHGSSALDGSAQQQQAAEGFKGNKGTGTPTTTNGYSMSVRKV